MRIYPHEKFKAVYWAEIEDEKWLSTLNLAPGKKIYGERLIEWEGKEYRLWDPYRSKLAASILKGMKCLPILPRSKVLYLGTATGTTCSHVSDIVGKEGMVFGVEFAYRPLREFINNVCTFRPNIMPIFADARKPELYRIIVSIVDCMYVDLAQPEQAKWTIENAKWFLKEGGDILIAIKARAIDVMKPVEEIYEKEIKVLEEGGCSIAQIIDLNPFDIDHVMIHAKF